jgi:predicted amidohydrolase YtcJ
MTRVVLTGGTVLTCDAGDSVAQAIALDGGRILCTARPRRRSRRPGPGRVHGEL